MGLTRETIVATAVDLLQRDGLDALTLRRLATELHVSAPTLYWHIRSKRELLDLVAEELVRRQEAGHDQPGPGQPWWEWLRLHARAMFDALIETRDAPRVLAGNRPSPDSLPRLDRILGTLIAAGLPPADAQHALFALGSYVMGSALEWQGEAAREAEGDQTDGRLAEAFREGDFPHLTAAVAAVREQPPRASFEYGLDLLIDALRTRYADPALTGRGPSAAAPVG